MVEDEPQRARQVAPQDGRAALGAPGRVRADRIAEQRKDFSRGAPRRCWSGSSTLAYYGEWANKMVGEVLPVDGSFLTYTLREPVGVVGAIIPWNFPTSLAAW